jgi:hypothetical protein
MTSNCPGFYSDSRGREAIRISIDNRTISTEIRGVRFTGDSFDDLMPATNPGTEIAFSLHHGALCSCTIEWTMPVTLATRGCDQAADLHCRLILGDPGQRGGLDREDLHLTLNYNTGRAASGAAAGDFETALIAVQRELLPGVELKACISCGLSDYSPAGSGLFGSLACFRDNADAYQTVSSKQQIFQIWDTFTEYVAETYLCPRYQRRKPHAGYRGGFPEA